MELKKKRLQWKWAAKKIISSQVRVQMILKKNGLIKKSQIMMQWLILNCQQWGSGFEFLLLFTFSKRNYFNQMDFTSLNLLLLEYFWALWHYFICPSNVLLTWQLLSQQLKNNIQMFTIQCIRFSDQAIQFWIILWNLRLIKQWFLHLKHNCQSCKSFYQT